MTWEGNKKPPPAPVGAQEAMTRGSTLVYHSIADIGAKPGGITRRAPGRTSHPAAADPLSAGEGSSLFFAGVVLFPFFALVTGYYIIIFPSRCQVRPVFFSFFPLSTSG